jgi:hypothetical protein
LAAGSVKLSGSFFASVLPAGGGFKLKKGALRIVYPNFSAVIDA